MTFIQKTNRYLVKILKYFSLILATLIAFIPIVSCINTAMKSKEEYISTTIMELPSKLNFSNFYDAWERANMGRAFMNTSIVLAFVLTGSILIGSMLAYVLSRFVFHGNGFIRLLFLVAALLPGVAMQVPTYKIMVSLGLINSLPGYILVMMGTDVISIYIFIQFFENIPISLDESAIMDGCTYFGVFFRILFPLLKPAIITCMILKGVATYNEYYMAHLYLQRKSLVTVATSLYTFTGPLGNQYNMICAGVLISILPAFLIFVFCQKQIYSGLTSGAVKG